MVRGVVKVFSAAENLDNPSFFPQNFSGGAHGSVHEFVSF